MFEQQLFDQEVPAAPLQPGDPFYNYEIKNWDLTPRIYKILAGSAILNIVALLVIGSTGLLTARGCDSPFVGRVCQVLDTVYVGSVLFGKENEYSNTDYDPTKLNADTEVTFLDVTGVSPPLNYPDGYFQLANPEQFQNVTENGTLEPGFLAPGIPMSPMSGGLVNTPPVAPPSNPNAFDRDQLPTSVLGTPDENPTTAGGPNRKGRRRKGPGLGNLDNTNTATNNSNSNNANPTVAEDKNECKQDQNLICLNRKPLTDMTTTTLAQVDAGKVKLDSTFRVVITGTLGLAKDGKTVILKDPKVEPVDKNFPADPALTKLAQDWVVAVGDSGWYGYLGFVDDKKGIGKKLTILIEQNDQTFIANVKSEQANPERANTAATGLRNLMTIGALTAKEDEITFLKSANLSSDGNLLLVNFEMPKTQVQEMIQRKLAEFKEKGAKPEGSAVVKPPDNRAER